EVQIERQAGEEDKLFGSVTSRDIEAALKDKGITIDHRKVHMAEPIKTIGYHTIEIRLGTGITGKIKVVVVPKQA
ncbi:MAG: ribosomal protein, partial [bacterium]|nr:ribosomal protein [bacterium]